MHNYAVIVAGGKGERMGVDTPKQFLELSGQPIIMHTIDRFREALQQVEIILVLPENQIGFWEELCCTYTFHFPSDNVVKGGSTRFHSVRNGLSQIKDEGIVAIHDGVRPLVSAELIRTCFKTAQEKQNIVPVIDLKDSIRFVSKQEGTNKSVNRSCYKIVQTPQCFSTQLILKAYMQEYNSSFTDDASVVEQLGEKIHLLEGETQNIKITTKEDLEVAKALFTP